MEEKEYQKALQMAKNAVPCGVYALQFPGYTEIRNDILTKTQTKKARRHYKAQGIKALCTGIGGA